MKYYRSMRCKLLLLFLLAAPLCLVSQQFGGLPPSHKWKQVNTDSFRIIFQPGLDSQANRVASVISHLASSRPVSLGEKLKKINIVLQNRTVVPNGYVQLGPFRSEFLMTPTLNSFDQGSISWTDQLAIHEYRHVQQFNNFDNGLSSVMKVLFGEEGYSLAINAAIPDWFYEGDAVYMETALTQQGRGRLPLFVNAYPSLWQAGKKYSWMKLRNGSLKDYIPGHYHLGYLLVNYGRKQYGQDFWTKVTKGASAWKGLVYPFQQAIKKHAGVDYKTFYEQAFAFYKEKAGRESSVKDEFLFPVKKNVVTNYLFPYHIGTDSLLYLKSAYNRLPAFYIRDKEKEHKLFLKDVSIDNQYAYRNGKIVYAAYENDARWSWKSYSVIKVFDMKTSRIIRLTHKSKYFTPDISADGSKVAAVQVDENGKSELHILEVPSAEIVKRISSPEISLFADPKFVSDDSLIAAVRLPDGKMTLAGVNIPAGTVHRLIPASFNVIGYPNISGDTVFFTASFQGNDDVFALRMADNKLYKVTDGPLGNYYVNASPDGKLTWSAFTAEGYQLKQADEKKLLWEALPLAEVEMLKEPFVVSTESGYEKVFTEKIEWRQYPSLPYRKSTKLINLHSWRPNYEDPVFTFSVYGENVLNTLQTELTYSYNQSEKTNSVGFSATYAGLFPFLNAGTEFTFGRQGRVGERIAEWNQLDTRLGFIIPLNQVKGRTQKALNFSTFYYLRNEFNKGFLKDSLGGNTSFSYMAHNLSWAEQLPQAVQHINPRWGYAFATSYRYPINRYEGYQLFGSASFYLPGILPSHSLVLNGAIQQRDTTRLLFSTRLADARGYEDYYITNAGSRIWRLSANYHFPLLYPDWGFGNILYLQRVRANAFYDYQRIFSNDKSLHLDFRSIGGEIYVDTKWWNQHPLTFGFRISYLIDDDPLAGNAKGTSLFEFILPVSIIPR